MTFSDLDFSRMRFEVREMDMPVKSNPAAECGSSCCGRFFPDAFAHWRATERRTLNTGIPEVPYEESFRRGNNSSSASFCASTSRAVAPRSRAIIDLYRTGKYC